MHGHLHVLCVHEGRVCTRVCACLHTHVRVVGRVCPCAHVIVCVCACSGERAFRAGGNAAGEEVILAVPLHPGSLQPLVAVGTESQTPTHLDVTGLSNELMKHHQKYLFNYYSW